MKREWYVGCRLENGEECHTPFIPVTRYEDAPALGGLVGPPGMEAVPVEPIQKQKLWEAFLSTESAIDTRYPEEMEAKLPPELRGLKI